MAAIIRSHSSPYIKDDRPRGLAVGMYSPMRQPQVYSRNPIASKPPTPPRARHNNSYMSSAFAADPGPGAGWRSSMKTMPETSRCSDIFGSSQGVVQHGNRATGHQARRFARPSSYMSPNYKPGSDVFDNRPFASPKEDPDYVKPRQSAHKKTKSSVFSDSLPQWGGSKHNAVPKSAPVRRGHNPTFKSVAFDVSPEKPKPYMFRESHRHNDFLNPEFTEHNPRGGGKKMYDNQGNSSTAFDPYVNPSPVRKRKNGKPDHHLYPLEADSNIWPMTFDEIHKGRGVKTVANKPHDNDVFNPKTDYFWEGKPAFKMSDRGRATNDIFNTQSRNQVSTAPRLIKGKPHDHDGAFGFGRGAPDAVQKSAEWRQQRLESEARTSRKTKTAPGYDSSYIEKAQQNRQAFLEYAKKKRGADGKFSKDQMKEMRSSKSAYLENKRVSTTSRRVADDVFNPTIKAPRLKPRPQEQHLYKMEDFSETKVMYASNKRKKNKPVFIPAAEGAHPLKPTQKARNANKRELNQLRRNITIAKMSAQGHLM
jgi:hypothetical protein